MTLQELQEATNKLANTQASEDTTIDPVARAHTLAAIAALHSASALFDLAQMAQAQALAKLHLGNF